MKIFICPTCNRRVNLGGDFGELSLSNDHYEYRLANKRYHMRGHKKLNQRKKKLERLRLKVKALEELIAEERIYY